MARSQIVITPIVRAGVAPITQTTADATNKHYIADQPGNMFLEIVSTDGGAQTVVIEANPDLDADGLTFTNLTITIPAGATRLCGPFRTRTFKHPADSNRMYVNPSVSTTLKFRAWSLAPVS